MYIGRFVTLGRMADGSVFIGYRVSSRSFPNRKLIETDRGIQVVNLETATTSRFVSYHALVCSERLAVAGNGDHVNYIFDQISGNAPVKQALTNVLNGMSYEHDQYNTPRIAGVIDKKSSECYLGIVSESDLLIQKIELKPLQIQYIATYNHNTIDRSYRHSFSHNSIKSAKDVCNVLVDKQPFSEFSFPVSCCSALAIPEGFAKSIRNEIYSRQ